jgi:hypothetical protein
MTPRMDWDDPEARLDALPNRPARYKMRCCGSTSGRAWSRSSMAPRSARLSRSALWRGLHGGLTERWRADKGGRSRSSGGGTARTEGGDRHAEQISERLRRPGG